MNKKCPTPYPGGTCGCGQGCETDMVEFRKMNAHLLPPENANSKQIGGDHYQAQIGRAHV